MKNLSLSDLSQPVRDFLLDVERHQGVLIHDDAGRLILSPIRCPETSEEERSEARRDLEQIQKKIGDRLRSLGVSEEEFDRAVQAED